MYTNILSSKFSQIHLENNIYYEEPEIINQGETILEMTASILGKAPAKKKKPNSGQCDCTR